MLAYDNQFVEIEASSRHDRLAQRVRRCSVVVARLQHDDVSVGHEVDETICLIDASGPSTRQDVLKRLGFADTSEGVSQDILNQQAYSLKRLPVLTPPVGVVLPAACVEGELSTHASRSSWGSNSPRRARSSAASSRSAPFAFLSKYAVSVMAS